MADFRKGLKKFTYDDDCDAEPEESSLNEEENDVPLDTGESEEDFDSSSTSATSKSGFESPECTLSEESVISSSKPRKKKGRRVQWPEDMVDDLVDIICESDYFKRKLIFTNNKAQENKKVYERAIKILKEQCRNREIPTDFSFTVDQTRVKFKGCVSICKKIALNHKTASGIKNVVEKKGFGAWFMKLFAIVKTRD